MFALNNHIQDILDGIDAIHALEEQIGESHAISEQMRAVTMKSIEMFNSGIDEIITHARDPPNAIGGRDRERPRKYTLTISPHTVSVPQAPRNSLRTLPSPRRSHQVSA